MGEALPSSARSVRATVMFASLVGYTGLSAALGPERAYLIVTGCLRGLDAIARRHGGAVDKYLGDSLMVVFGHPLLLANAARAAIAAALEMRQHVRDYHGGLALSQPLGVHVGIASGPLVAGEVGGRVVREFHVLGDTVNVAARLKSKAPVGAIYVSEATREEAGESFAFEPLAALALKGKSRRVAAFEALAERASSHAQSLAGEAGVAPPLVGRDAELARLQGAAGRLAAGRGGAVAILGEEGSGKSRLLSALAPALAGVETLVARPAAGALASPLGVIAELLAGAALAIRRPDEDVATALRRHLEASTQPVVVAVDDLERADAASLAALAGLLELSATRPLLFLVTARPRPGAAAEALLARLRTLPGEAGEEITLGPLAADAVRRLLTALQGESPLSEDALRLVEARAAGNPARLVLGVHLAPALATERDHAASGVERSSDAERRRATIVFADITGFTAMTEGLGAETAYPIVAGCLQLLDEVARRHGGHVDKYLGDCVMATFGVPEAIEDAPRAAINAAIEMRQRVREYNGERALPLPLDLHVGIHTGLGIAGDVSGPLLREFAVMGEPVDVAQQLTDLAEAGQIFIGGDTQRLVRDVFELRSRGPLASADGSAAIEAFELVSDRVQLHRGRIGVERRVFSALVGRETELGELRARLAELHTGRGAMISLVAEAGLGKSRLVAELAASPEAQALVWLEGRSLSTGRNLSFHPFADLLRAWAGIEDLDDEDAARKKLDASVAGVLPEEADDTATLLANLLGLRLADAERERLARIPGDVLEKWIHRAVTQLLTRGASVAPVVVVFDDLHWADESSIELLEALLPLAADHALLFLGVTRPGFAATSGRIGEAARRSAGLDHAEIALAPLSHTAARHFVNNLFEADGLPHATRALIEAKTQGNPFFIEEVVRSLLDEGAVELREGRFRATERIHQVEIPNSVHEVVMARVGRLPLRRRTLLQLASVIGRSFHESVLGAVVDRSTDLGDELRDLEAAEFIVPWDQMRGAEWAFKHPLLHEVTYDALLETRREALHRQVARAIETSLPPEIAGWAGMLAYHFSKGREPERAEDYLFRAGEEAARVAASSEALRFFEQASQLYLQLHGDGGDPRKMATLERNVGFALFNRGRLLEALDHFDAALSHLGERAPRGDREMWLRFARSLVPVLAGLYLPIERRRAASEVDREVIELLWKRGQAQTTASRTRIVFDNVRALSVLDRVDARTVPTAGAMYATAIGIFSYAGVSFAIGRRFLERARRLVRSDDVPNRCIYRAMNFIHHTLVGDWSEEHAVDPELLQEGLRYGRLWEVTNVLNLDGNRRLYRGEFAQARERIEALAKIADQYGFDLAASAGRFLQAMVHLERRELDAAIAALDLYADEHPDAPFQVSALGHRAAAQWLGGDVTGAEATLARAERILAQNPRVLPYHLSNYLRTRQILDVHALETACREGAGALRRAAAKRARASRTRALRAAAKVAWRRPEVLRSAGSEAWILGRTRAAQRSWDESLAWARRLGMRAEEARTLCEIGRRRGDAEALAAADKLLAALGLPGDRDPLAREASRA